MHPPLFVIGSPRSGTTLLRLMLTCHPAIVVPPECGFIVWLYAKWGGWNGDENPESLRSFVTDLFACRKFDTWRLDADQVAQRLLGAKPRSYRDLVTEVYLTFAVSRGEMPRRWGDKNNFHVRHVEEIRSIFPDALFVHIVRDGRDVACSYLALAKQTFDSPYAPSLPRDIEGIARDWSDNVEAAREGFARLGWAGVHEVRFSHLVLDPEAELRRLCRFLEEPYDPAMLTYPSRTEELEPPPLMPWKRKTVKPPQPEEVGRYQKELHPEEIARFEAVASPTLHTYGFLH